MAMEARRRGHEGFTLLEVVVVLLLLSLVLAGVLPLLTTGEQSYDDARRRQEMLRNARVALERIVRELRSAQALRSVSDGVLRFDVAAEAGEVPTVEFALDPATGDLEYRWLSRWDYRRRITVQARATVAVPAGYSVYVCFDHASLVSAGKSGRDGEDVRVRFWDGSRMVELDRFLDPTTSWNSTHNRSNCPSSNPERQVKVWFRLRAPIPAGGQDNRYFLYYGNPEARTAPSNPDHVFLDYEDGKGLEGWTPRDGQSGTYSPTQAEGFRFSASSGNGYRELSRPLAHSGVEVFWRFASQSGTDNGRQVGVGVRLSDVGAGYRLTPGGGNGNNETRFRYWTTWAQGGGELGASSSRVIQPKEEYYGRVVAVGTQLKAAVWHTDLPDPRNAWHLEIADSRQSSGSHFSIVNGVATPMDHRHQFVWVRMRVEPEPATSLGNEEPGAQAEPLAVLAGPFRSMTVTCFDRTGLTVPCSDPGSVYQVEVRLVALDREGKVPDIPVAARVALRSP